MSSISTHPPSEFAALCDGDGVVCEWLRDDLGISEPAGESRIFVRMLHESNYEKGLEFLAALQRQEAAVDWDMCFPLANGPRVLRVAGCRSPEGTLVIGSESTLRLSQLCQAIGQSHPGLVAACETIAARLSIEPGPDDDISIYEQLMRMYNEFARLQREYASQNSKLRRLADEKDNMMNMAVHDLKSPLNAISLMAISVKEIAADRLTEQEIDALEKIVQTAQEMGVSLTELLDSARHKLGEPELALAEVDFSHLVQERIALLDPLAARKAIRIALNCDVHLPRVAIDPVRMQHVVDNVIGNAIKYSPPGEPIEVAIDMAGTRLQMHVRDRGPGVPEADLTRIFRPFEKGSAKPTGGEVSNGLGLAICHAVLNAHGGDIVARNLAGGGAEFVVTLPVQQPANRRQSH